MESPLTRFSATADDYRRYRPDYPSELFDWLLAQAGVGAGARVLDLGCGTGISARQLAERGLSVVGLDPNGTMLARAREAAGGPRYIRGAAEHLPFRPHGFELATGAQCFHWFDLDRVLPALGRAVVPGGSAAAFWNVRRAEGLAGAYDELLLEHSREFAAVERGDTTLEVLRECVAPESEAEFEHEQVMSLEAFLGRARSSSYVVHGVDDRPAFDRALTELFHAHERRGTVRLGYRVIAILWRADRGGIRRGRGRSAAGPRRVP